MLAYLTDVEGMWSKVESFATTPGSVDDDLRHGVHLDRDGRLVVGEGTVFVFGGDAVDRGPHGRRVVATLLEAKRRQPDRVVLLAGNRDVNKLRLHRELGGRPPDFAPDALKAPTARAALLRFLFERTMGAKDAFEHRRTELAYEGLASSDDDVVDSYVEDVAPDGAIGEYLAACQLAYRAGETLFLHGGVDDASLGFVPNEPRTSSVDEWVERLNGFYAEQMRAFRDQRLDASGEPTWAPLIAYQAPVPGTRTNPASVVYGRLGDEWNNLRLPSETAVDTLASAGIERVVLGHTPSGDTPSIVRHVTPARRFEVVVADNSHGRVDSATRLVVDGSRLAVRGRARLDDGTEHDVAFDLHLADDASPIGRVTRDGRLVKGRLADGRLLLFRALPGWVIEQTAVLPGSLDADLPPLR